MKIKNIIVHCSDSSWGSAAEIRGWHLKKGWRDIGYHFVILNGVVRPNFLISCMDGSIEVGRRLDEDLYLEEMEAGAHTLGYNKNSIGICLIGKETFTDRQFESLVLLLESLMARYELDMDAVLGHCETASGIKQGKSCPNFSMSAVKGLMFSSRY